jgi:hypothetical protein
MFDEEIVEKWEYTSAWQWKSQVYLILLIATPPSVAEMNTAHLRSFREFVVAVSECGELVDASNE